MKKIVLSSALVLAMAGTALAQTPTTFADVDADSSGELSLVELQTVWPDIAQAEFGGADVDSSGGLSSAEVSVLQAAAAPAPVPPAAAPAAEPAAAPQ